MDNVAKVFLASANERDTRSFRMTCTLKEDIDEDILGKAVLEAAKERPQYQVTILRGFFWHYMEPTADLPTVKKEDVSPCPMLIDQKTFGKLHYQVSYYNNRINLDFFHAIADGNGAIEFLNLIVKHYLQIKYPGEFQGLSMVSGASEADLSQDSFKQFYSNNKKYKSISKAKRAYHIKGAKHPYNQTQFLEVRMPVKDVIAKAKENGVSLTSFIGASLMMAVFKDMPVLMRNRPVTISMPVNLRNYYPSNTSRNFFNSVSVSHNYTQEDLGTVAKKYQADLKEQLTPEAVEARMQNFEKIETVLYIRMVPLFIKNPVVNAVNRKITKSVTAVVSNLGILSVPEEVSEHIESYSAFCSTSSLFVVISTFKDELVLGISCAYRNTQVLRDFIKGFADEGIDVTVYSTELFEEGGEIPKRRKEKKPKAEKKKTKETENNAEQINAAETAGETKAQKQSKRKEKKSRKKKA